MKNQHRLHHRVPVQNHFMQNLTKKQVFLWKMALVDILTYTLWE